MDQFKTQELQFMLQYMSNSGINIEWVKSNHTYLLLEINFLNLRIKRYVHVNIHRGVLLGQGETVSRQKRGYLD